MSVPVVILAAGRGTRMRDLAADKPKHLIEAAGRPFLSYVLDNLSTAGYRDLFLVVGYQAPAAYSFAQREASRWQLTIVNQFERLGEERYGTLVPLEAVARELGGQEVIVVSGDNLYSPADLARVGEAPGSAVAALEHDYPERYGVVVAGPGNTVARIVEKPDQPPSRLINTGLYRLSASLWQLMPKVGRSPRGEYELTDVVNLLAEREPVRLVKLHDYWYDFGRPEDIPLVEAAVRTPLKA